MNEWSNAEHHAEQARQFYETGQWDKALNELKLALAVNPHHSDWHFGMGLILEAMQRYEEAVASFEQVVRLRGDDIEAMLHQADDLIRIGHSSRAIEVLEAVSRIDPDCEPAYCHRIAAYAQIDEHDQAEQMFYMAQQITEDCPRCFDHIAYSLAARDDMERAIWCWQRALRIDPHYPDANANLGRAHWQRGQLDLARHFFLQHLREEPGDMTVLMQLGALLIEMDRLPEAREKFHRVLEQDPTVADAHLHLGELALLEGQLESASAEFEMTQRLDPDRPGVSLGLAKIALRRSRPDLARHFVQAELKREGHNPLQIIELSSLLIDLRLPLQAVKLLSPLIDEADERFALHDDRLATAMLYRGVAWILLGRTETGIVQCRRAVKLAPDNLLAMQNLVLAEVNQGQFKRAAYWLQRATRLKPDDPVLRRLKHRLRRARVSAALRQPLCWLMGKQG